MNAYIEAVGSYVPSRRMSNDELAQIVDTSDEWIFSHTGIRFRHIAAPGESASDLAVAACRNLFSAPGATIGAPADAPAGVGAGGAATAGVVDGGVATGGAATADAGGIAGVDTIDMILLATSTPDYPGLPSTACVVQDRLGIANAGAMDVVAACTGFIYAMETARAYVECGAARRVLVIGTEVYSRIIDWHDRTTCVLFGDGAGAVVVSAAENGAPAASSAVLRSVLGSKGSGVQALLRPAGGSRTTYVPGVTPEADLFLQMDGRKVYLFAVQAIIDTILAILEKNGVALGDVDHFVPHQANRRIIEASCKRAGLPLERFFMNIDEYANTSAASIPIALDEMQRRGLLHRGQLVMTIGFGSGLTFGGNLFRW